MDGKVHISLGTFVGVTGAIYLTENPIHGALFIVGTIIGSDFPDIDRPNSIIGQKLPIISKLVNKIFGHRGFIHSPIFYYLMYFGYQFLNTNQFINIFFIGMLIGCIFHLSQDIFTKGGIPLFYPLLKDTINLGFFKSGSVVDPFITSFIGLIWLMILWLFFGF